MKKNGKENTVVMALVEHGREVVDAVESGVADGEGAVGMLCGVLCLVARQKTGWEEEKELAGRVLRMQLAEAEKEAAGNIRLLNTVDKRLRDVLGRVKEDADSVVVDGAGVVEFRAKTVWEVVDFARVPKKYLKLVVDEEKVEEDVKAGVREIKGVEVKRQYTPVVKLG